MNTYVDNNCITSPILCPQLLKSSYNPMQKQTAISGDKL